MLRNGLYIVATPIGNLQDISSRALEILQAADIIACEDTRMAKKLFTLLGIPIAKTFFIYEDHNETTQTQKLINLIQEGKIVALISDAGSPLISDPGYKLVQQCRTQNIYVTAIPGACAVITALQISGLPTNRFMFAGFIPNKDKARQDLFHELQFVQSTLIFYETAPRLLKTLNQAKPFFIDRQIAVVRELTKVFEETICGTITDVLQHFTDNEPRGEFVLIIAPPNISTSLPIDITDILRQKLKETSLKTAVSELTEKYKLNKNEVYALALKIKDEKLS